MEPLESSAIALFIRSFNIVSTVVLACFAIYGLVVVIRRKRSAKFLPAFCVAALLAFVTEAVFFNYERYLKYFAGDEFSITKISSESLDISDSDAGINLMLFKNAKIIGTRGDVITGSAMLIKNLNRKVTSIFIQPNFNTREQLDIYIRWTDETGISGTIPKTFYAALPHENYIAIHPCANVSELELFIPKQLITDHISQIAVNRQIPFYFCGLRLFVVTLLFFTIILFVYKPLSVKAYHYLFEYKFDPANRKQTAVYVGFVILTLFFSWFCIITATDSKDALRAPINFLYNKYLVDALISGKANIDYEHPEELLNAKYPYSRQWLKLNGYAEKVNFEGDLSYYKGKFYIYYGVVPAALLYLPYKLITGSYLSHYAGIFLFTSIAVFFLALLWRFFVKKHLPDARFAFVLLSFWALFFVSHLFANIRSPGHYTVVAVAGFAFLIFGTFLLLKSVDKENINRLQLFFACLCFALSVGCRPDMVFASVLVPAVLWKRRSWKLAVFTLIPYIMVAIPQCFYNYVRFDSILEFGHKYCIGAGSGPAADSFDPLGKIRRMFLILIFYVFRLYEYSFHFPFVELVQPSGLISYSGGFPLGYNQSGGLINFPILFCLLYLFKNIFRKNRPRGFYLSSVFLVIAVAMILAYARIGIFHGRYLLDCSIFLMLPSLWSAYYWCGEKTPLGKDAGCAGVSQNATRLKIVYLLLIVSIFVGMFRFVTGSDHLDNARYHDPALYRYLESSLGIPRLK
jgi:hypothetical protein